MRSKTQILKLASTLTAFSTKVKSAQIGETLTPETVKEISEEIMEVASVAAELANEIAEGVPAEEENRDALGERGEEEQPKQIEVAQDETEEEKKKRMDKEKTAAQDDDKDKENEELKEKVAKLERKGALAELAPKYANLYPESMREAKMNDIINSKQSLQIVEARIQEASENFNKKTMIKIASMNDSMYDFNTSDGDEIDISSVI